ncbi:MAG TPA: PEP-CTERM sorting domain-containing protein [Rhodocyclaceae bacterium]|nr:PEP-CTERM sorting domain-containing protein [Rhodocyclaceae bacterium]HMV55201.1 PEP-CTERM sorting domain-containing protein [Rhodocyclaceae bacterium]HMZ84717.1 PEP-CTERM sorting domain-containing protein [Rhodocyclaceae bacterium]HNA04446.1 PEP-CTERM sorting domain-containing protein [Rhodocyclaceae bacterium]HNB79739.1 PEP-CTERM sorting domain-containing protein [Rhodocyclaceae bacterium]
MAGRLGLVLAGAVFALFTGGTAAGQVDFDEGDAFVWGGQSVLSGGYSFLAVSQGPLAFAQIDAQPDIVGNGSRRLLAGNRTEIAMTRVGGGKFDLLGLSLGGSWTDPDKRFRWADAIEIVGSSGGTPIMRRVDLLSSPARLQSFLLDDFVGLDSVLFRPVRYDTALGSNYEFVLDDLRVASVPEPEAWLMLGAGLALLALRRRQA